MVCVTVIEPRRPPKGSAALRSPLKVKLQITKAARFYVLMTRISIVVQNCVEDAAVVAQSESEPSDGLRGIGLTGLSMCRMEERRHRLPRGRVLAARQRLGVVVVESRSR
jgi:hypothetical protein